MKIIKLTNSERVVLVDDEDYEYLNQYKWHLHVNGARGRIDKLGKTERVFMHHLLFKPSQGFVVDHEDTNNLNNQKSNIREATKAENGINRGKQRNNTSGKKGVSWSKQANKWQVGIGVNGKRIHLGFFSNLQEAANAYEEKVKELYGKFART